MTPLMLFLRAHPRLVGSLGLALIAVVLLTFVYVKGRHDNAKLEDARDAIAETAALKSGVKANDAAGLSLEQAAKVTVEKQKELTDAVAAIPDTRPDPVRVAAGCVELCQQGTSVADLPACWIAGSRTPTCRPR